MIHEIEVEKVCAIQPRLFEDDEGCYFAVRQINGPSIAIFPYSDNPAQRRGRAMERAKRFITSLSWYVLDCGAAMEVWNELHPNAKLPSQELLDAMIQAMKEQFGER